MSKLEQRPEWYAKAAAEPLRKTMFTQKHKQQILNRIKQEEKSKFQWSGYIGKFAAATGIVMVALAIFLWGNMDENHWFSKETGIDPSENIEAVYPMDFTSWNEEMVYQFLNEVQQFVRTIPLETTSKEEIIERYEKYFSPELSREIFNSLYIETEGKWKIPDGDGGYMFTVPNKEQNEVSIYATKDSIIVEEKYEYWMYSKVQYIITYDKKPLITEWIRFMDDHADFNTSKLFDAATVQLGEEIANMKVVYFDLHEVENLYLGTVQFNGTTLLTGTLTYSNDDMGELLLFTADTDSMTKLPRMTHDTREASLTFTNIEEAKTLMGIGAGTGHVNETVAVEIEDYFINYQEKEVRNTAKLNKVYFEAIN